VVKHGVRRGEQSTMADQVRRKRRDSRRSGWRILLLGSPMSAAANSEVRSGPPPTVLTRLAVRWPSQFYRQVEERWNYGPSEFLFRTLLLILVLVLAGLLGGVAALVAWATGHAAMNGFADGVVLSCLLVVVAVAYLGWGGLVDRLSRRRQAR
jgi:hypothetical protein